MDKMAMCNSVFQWADLGRVTSKEGDRLQEAALAGAVEFDDATKKAAIVTPPGFAGFTDDEITQTLQAASYIGAILERLGFEVRY
jgi:hypothetical protein